MSPMYQAMDASYPDPQRSVVCSCSSVIAAHMQDLAVEASAQQGAGSLRKRNLMSSGYWWVVDAVGAVLMLPRDCAGHNVQDCMRPPCP